MISAGDEFGRTRGGNNNYCQDNPTSWLDWRMDEGGLSLVTFFRRLTAAFHLYPVLRCSSFLTGEMNPAIEVKDVMWIDATGSEMTAEAWVNGTRCFAMLLAGAGKRLESSDAALTLLSRSCSTPTTRPSNSRSRRVEAAFRHDRP
jgi:glycogen operon protein